MGLSGEKTFGLKKMVHHQPPVEVLKMIPDYLLMHPGTAFENKTSETITFKTFQ